VPTFSLADFVSGSPTVSAGDDDIAGSSAAAVHAEAAASEAATAYREITLPQLSAHHAFQGMGRVDPSDELSIVTAVSVVTAVLDSVWSVVQAVQTAMLIGGASSSSKASHPGTGRPPLSPESLDLCASRLHVADELVTQALVKLDSIPKGQGACYSTQVVV
jgi:hypothetical protein